jgi:hypothetical protein
MRPVAGLQLSDMNRSEIGRPDRHCDSFINRFGSRPSEFPFVIASKATSRHSRASFSATCIETTTLIDASGNSLLAASGWPTAQLGLRWGCPVGRIIAASTSQDAGPNRDQSDASSGPGSVWRAGCCSVRVRFMLQVECRFRHFAHLPRTAYGCIWQCWTQRLGGKPRFEA